MAIASNFPSSRPSLLLDFANVGRLDPRVTFTRASSATFYDGVTTAKAEQNLLLQSQTFNTTWATNGSSITGDTTTAPDGTVTADTLTEDNTTGTHRISQLLPSLISSNVGFSVRVKPDTKDFVTLVVTSSAANNFISATFDLSSTGVVSQTNVGSTTGTIVSTGVKALAQGFYEIFIIGSANAANSAQICLSDSSTPSLDTFGRPTYTGNGSDSFFIWGAQLEQRSSVTAYTATTTQPITNYVPVLLTAQNNEARFDHTPTTGAALGLLIEEQRTNLVTYSEDFADAAWTKNDSSITSNTIVAPDGTLTGDKLVSGGSGTPTFQGTVQTISATAAASRFSVYAKAGEITQIEMRAFGATSNIAIFDLSAGTVVSGSEAGSPDSQINAVGNGWYRISINTTAGNTSFRFSLAVNGNRTFASDGYSGIYIWGAQLEAGAFATSYIKTTSASVTRNADVASMTGTNFSDWFNNAEGTVYIDYTEGGLSTYNLLAFSDGTTTNIYLIRRINSTVLRTQGSSSGTALANLDNSNSQVIGQRLIRANGYKVGDNASVLNGATPVTNTSTTLFPVVDRLSIGSSYLGAAQVGGCIRRIAYYPIRVTDAQLQALTG